MSALTADTFTVWQFVHRLTRVPLTSDARAIGLVRDKRVVAGVLFERWTATNVWVHIAVEAGARVPPKFVRAPLEYVFHETGRRSMAALIDESNVRSRGLAARLGFEVEGRLRGAAEDGGDQLLYVLRRESLAWRRWAPRAKDGMLPAT